jgi:hypothetical protein
MDLVFCIDSICADLTKNLAFDYYHFDARSKAIVTQTTHEISFEIIQSRIKTCGNFSSDLGEN